MAELNLVTQLHTSTSRDYLGRMLDDKVGCMRVARQYGREFWDGPRRFGYGGYRYIPGRWKSVAEKLIKRYSLGKGCSVMDFGCGKGFLLHEMKVLEPDLKVCGCDISDYAIGSSLSAVRGDLWVQDVREKMKYEDNHFDLSISLATFHNLSLVDLVPTLREFERVGRDKYLMVESYRDETELFNLQCWALTAESFFTPEEWRWVFDQSGYTGDYEFIFFN